MHIFTTRCTTNFTKCTRQAAYGGRTQSFVFLSMLFLLFSFVPLVKFVVHLVVKLHSLKNKLIIKLKNPAEINLQGFTSHS